jgi:predicted Zn-dependent protease
MKNIALAAAFVLTATPAFAQFGGLDRFKKAAETVQKVAEIKVSEKDERALGEEVSRRIRDEFGVYQDKDVTKYVTLVGMVMAQASTRPDLKWEFIVLDTDGVNAFAAPGGLVHITRGALGLMKSEAELAGVLAHEISHITKKHTVNSIQRNKTIKVGTDVTTGSSSWISLLADVAYDNIVEKGFDLGDENDGDQEGIRLANKVGYHPSGLSIFLTKLAERNAGATNERNGLFASHPDTKTRLDKIGKQITSEKLNATATVETRYKEAITFDVKPLSEIVTTDAAGSRGLAGGSSSKPDEGEEAKKKEEEPKKKSGGFLGGLKLTKGQQAESTQASASAGGRAVGKDRAAKGGDNPNKLSVPLTPAEIDAFKKGIAA